MKENIKIEYVKIEKLKPAEYNPRYWDEKQVEQLKKSIKKYGVVDPIIVNSAKQRRNIVIGGHFRLAVLKDLGWKEVPIVYVNVPDIKKEQELNLRLNRNQGSWNIDLLMEFDEDLLLDVGFEDELEAMWDAELAIEDDGFNIERAIKEIEKPSVRTGDIYQLGKSKLMCADSTKEENVLKLVGEEKVDMIYCDPPYNIGLDYSKGVGTSTKYRKDFPDLKYKGFKDTKKEREYKEFLDETIKNALQVAKKDVHIFYWCDQANIWMLQQLFKENGIRNRRVVLWIKNNFNMTPQIAFNKVYEPCVYGTIGKPYLNNKMANLNEILNKEVTSGVAVLDEILDMIDIWIVKREAAQNYQHPTQKPVTLNEKPIKRCSRPGDLILDLFGGSGSTLIAAEQLKRRAYLIEIDPVFAQVIINRWEEFTGQKAKKIESGEQKKNEK